MTEPFEVVRSGYDRIGARYREWSSASPVRLRWLRVLLGDLRPGSVVVDLGCGPGEPATRLLAQEHRVLAVDASLTQLGLARAAAPAALPVQADMARFSLRPGSVDAVVSLYALGHVPSASHAALLAAVARWLRPGGLLLANAPVGAGETTDPAWLGVPMFFGGIGTDATHRALTDASLDVERFEVEEEDEGGGRVVPFLWVVARRPG